MTDTSLNNIENLESKLLETIQEKQLYKMLFSKDKDILKFLEIFSSSILLALNEKLPEPNYSIYMTYRIKSPNSTISKLSNKILPRHESKEAISLKEFNDLIGMRIIVEKIPHSITLQKSHPEYETLKKMQLFRKECSVHSSNYHDFEVDVLENDCSSLDYYSKCKDVINDILNILNQDKESTSYATNLKKIYTDLIKRCDDKLNYLKVIGNYSTNINYNEILEKISQEKSYDIDFCQLLSDFDSRIDSQLALKLYSVTLPDIIKSSSNLQKLGISLNSSKNRTKLKREKSGYVANFFGLDIEGIPINCECQIMSIDEHLSSILGYSAHSNMPGKDPMPAEIPPAYVNRLMTSFDEIGKNNTLNYEKLKLFSKLIKIKNLNNDQIEVLSNIISNVSPLSKDPSTKNSNFLIDDSVREDLAEICTINIDERNSLRKILYLEGKYNFNVWANNISACHVTARLDKDSSAKDRIKIHYDNPYECLAHVMRQQVEGYNFDSFNSNLVELYLGKVYKHQNEWLNTPEITNDINKDFSNTYVEGSVMNFEIKDFINNDLEKLKDKIKTLNVKEKNEDIDFER